MGLHTGIDEGLVDARARHDVDSGIAIAEALRCQREVVRVVAAAQGDDGEAGPLAAHTLGRERGRAVGGLDLARCEDRAVA